MKINAPKIPYTLQEATTESFFTEDELDGYELYAVNAADRQLTTVYISSSLVKQCDFSNAAFQNANFTDVRFENCDFSNASFSLSSIHRVQFINCKFVGTKFANTSFGHVQFEQCMLTMASFESSKMEKIIYHQCTLQQLDFYDMKTNELLFDACDLSAAVFSQTKLNKVDISRSYFEQLTVDVNDVKGAIVSREQAVYFASMLGLLIAD